MPSSQFQSINGCLGGAFFPDVLRGPKSNPCRSRPPTQHAEGIMTSSKIRASLSAFGVVVVAATSYWEMVGCATSAAVRGEANEEQAPRAKQRGSGQQTDEDVPPAQSESTPSFKKRK